MSNTTDTKKYRLLKDISMPYRSIKAGTVGDCIEPHEYISFGEGVNSLSYSIKDIKNKPDWFEEVIEQPKQERITVTLAKGFIQPSENWTAHLYSTETIPPSKFPEIKSAIENVLNGDTVVEYNDLTGLIGVNIKGNVVNYNGSASIRFDNGVPSAIGMNGLIFLPEQPTNDNAFVWTDDLVKEFAYDYIEYKENQIVGKSMMESFKQSKQSSPTPQPPLYKEHGDDDRRMDSRTVLLIKEVLDYFDMNTTKVPPHLYKALFNSIYPPKSSPIQEDKPKLGDKALYNTFDTCYNKAIDHAIEIVQSEQKNFPLSFSVYSETAVKKIITSLTNLKKKSQ